MGIREEYRTFPRLRLAIWEGGIGLIIPSLHRERFCLGVFQCIIKAPNEPTLSIWTG